MNSLRIGLLLTVGCGASVSSPSDDQPYVSPFDVPTSFTPTPPGCVYQRFETTHPITRIGELSQCLDLALAGSELVSINYSDFVDGGFYLGGIAGTTLTRDGDAIALAVGPHHQRFVPNNGRHVSEDGPDGTWFEVGSDAAVYVVGSERMRFARFADDAFRAVALETLGGASGDRVISTIAIVRDATGNPLAIRDDFGRGVQLDYDAGQLVRITDVETQLPTELTWNDGRVTAVSSHGTTGAAVTTTLAYSDEGRLVGMTLPEIGRIAWDRRHGGQVATTRFLGPTDSTRYAVTSLGCIAIDGSRLAGVFGHPYGSDTLPAVYRIEHLLGADHAAALATRRRTNALGKYRESRCDAQNRVALALDEHGVGLAFSYAGDTQRITQVRSAITGIPVFDGVLADGPSMHYAQTHGLDAITTMYSYDASDRMTSVSVGGRTLRRTFLELGGGGTRICEQYDGAPTNHCVDQDANGFPMAVVDSGQTMASMQHVQGRLASVVDALGDQTSFQYTDPSHYLSRVDSSDGAPSQQYSYTPNGQPSAMQAGPESNSVGYSEAGRIDNWRNQLSQAAWNHALSRSADLLTTSYFVNGQRQWTEQTAAAPPPPQLSCNGTREPK